MTDARYYTVTESTVGAQGGRYASKSGPAAAAKKAASKRFAKGGGGTKLRLTVRELGTKRLFTYDAERVKLPKPVVRKIGDTTVTSEWRVDVKAVRMPKQPAEKKPKAAEKKPKAAEKKPRKARASKAAPPAAAA